MSAQDAAHDEFVAFAFASSDLLIEIDEAGVITFLAGALDRLGSVATHPPTGLPLLELLDPASREAAARHLTGLAEGRPVTPLMIRLRRGGSRAMMFGGCQLPHGRTLLFLALGDPAARHPGSGNRGTGAAQGLLTQPVFAALATRRLADDPTGALRLSFLEVTGFPALIGEIPAPVLRSLAGAIARQMRSSGPGIEAVGDFGRGHYGVLHHATLRVDDLAHAIKSLVLAASPEAPEPSLAATTTEPGRDGLHGKQAARVVRYAIERFAASGEGASAPVGPASPLDDLFADTVIHLRALESAITTGTFTIAYQPVVDLKDRVVRHAEALVRFRDGRSPLANVSAAEASDMIAEFDLAILARVLDHLDRRMAPDVPVAVNLSGRSLEGRGFAEKLKALLGARNAPADRLMFELTETAILGEVETVNRVVQDLREAGFRFCLDDLGSGANSFHYLRSIPMDFVKIDGAFGRDALKNERDRSFLRYVSGFCRENRILAIAEMIETEAEARQYLELGIDYGQGFLFGRPQIPREEREG